MSRDISLRYIQTDRIKLQIAEAGQGPLVILLHGWPESWYSWRHQIPALATAGYHVVAPELRGYGASEHPEAVEAYNMLELTQDIAELVEVLGEESAVVVGHDWGALVAWNCLYLHPDRFRAGIALSVPNQPRPPVPPTEVFRHASNGGFHFFLYFQDPGVAEKEFEANPEMLFRTWFTSPGDPVDPPQLSDAHAPGGYLARQPLPKTRPSWLSAEDFAFYVERFKAHGFRGGLNYYRNFDRNWELAAQLAGAKVSSPVMFIAGERDFLIGGATAEQLTSLMKDTCADLREVVLVPGGGHCIQQERPEEVTSAVLRFLQNIDKG